MQLTVRMHPRYMKAPSVRWDEAVGPRSATGGVLCWLQRLDGKSAQALCEATRWATAEGLGIRVLGPMLRPPQATGPSTHHASILHRGEHLAHARALQQFCEAHLGDLAHTAVRTVVQPDSRHDVFDVIRQQKPTCLVLAQRQGCDDSASKRTDLTLAQRVVERCQIPVLMCGSMGNVRHVLVASSLRTTEDAGLRWVGRLRLAHQVTCVHNAATWIDASMLSAACNGIWAPSPVDRGPREVHRIEARLRSLTARHNLPAEIVVTQEIDPVLAIQNLARQRRSSLVVVGHRPRSRLSTWLHDSIAARVYQTCTASLLLLPHASSQHSY